MESNPKLPQVLQDVDHETESNLSCIQVDETSWMNNLTDLVDEILEISQNNDACCFVPNENKVDNLNSLFCMIRKIGCGATSSVFLAQNRRTLKFVALKQLSIDDKHNLSSFENEYKILKKLNHKNIAKLYSCYIDEYNYYISTEYCHGGNLVDTILKIKTLNEKQAMKYVKTLVNTVKYLHDKNIVHRDLKLGNLVLDTEMKFNDNDNINHIDNDYKSDSNNNNNNNNNNCNNNDNSKNNDDNNNDDNNEEVEINDADIKLIDFGLAIEIKDDETNDEFVGTLVYLPPECVGVRTGKELRAGDMWSIGIIAYIFICGVVPFVAHDNESTLAKIKTQDVEWPKEINVSDECKDFIEKLLSKDPQVRLTAKEALKHSWVNSNEDLDEVSIEENHDHESWSQMYTKFLQDKVSNWLR